MSRQVKDMVIDDVRKRLDGARDVVVVDASKLDAVTATTMRLEMRKKNIRMLGVKNKLAEQVFAGMGITGLDKVLAGPSTLCYGSTDIVALTKEIVAAAKKNEKLAVKGGLVDGAALDGEGVKAISQGPSREETIGRIVMLMLSPAAQLAGALLGPGGTLCGQFKALGEKEEGAAEAASADGAAPAAS